MPSTAGARFRSLRFCRSQRIPSLNGHEALSNTSCTAFVLKAHPTPAPGVRAAPYSCVVRSPAQPPMADINPSVDGWTEQRLGGRQGPKKERHTVQGAEGGV